DHHPQAIEAAGAAFVFRHASFPGRAIAGHCPHCRDRRIFQPRARLSSADEEDCASWRRHERNRRAATANICQKVPLVGHMQLNVVVVMDPIGSLNIAKDSTFAMLLEAQPRRHALRYVQPGSLGMVHGQAYANLAPLTVRDDRSGWYELGPSSHRALGPGDLVLMRKDPPVDADFLHDTLILGTAQRQGALVVNDPRGLRDMNEKLAALEFPQCCPPTVVSREAATLKAFVAEHGDAVLKPLDGMGGRSIFRARTGDANLNVILETLTQGGRRLAMAQRYLPEIVDGDKRILLIDGVPVDYCLARIPQGDEFRGNLA